MVLGVKDKRVIKAFISHERAEGHKLSTDGVRLDGHWMGGSNIAEWLDDSIHFNDLGSRAAQTVQRAVQKANDAKYLKVRHFCPNCGGHFKTRSAFAAHNKHKHKRLA